MLFVHDLSNASNVHSIQSSVSCATSYMSISSLLSNRPCVGLHAIESVALMDRYDSKFLVPMDWLPEVIADLTEHHVLQVEQDHLIRYNNLYFDTKGNECLTEHVRGRTKRFKVRIRQYQNSKVAFLEVKLRDVYGKTAKKRMARSSDLPWNAPLTEGEILFLRGHLGDVTDELTPSLQSRFDRFTLVNLHRGDRITFDQNLQFSDPRKHLKAPLWTSPIPHLAVVEWKQRKLNHQCDLIQSFRAKPGRRGPLGRALRVSKYILGRMSVCDDLAPGAYRKTLRDIQRAELAASNTQSEHESILR